MSEADQTKAFAEELDSLVERFRQEFDLTYAGAVGVLTMKAYLLCRESDNENSE